MYPPLPQNCAVLSFFLVIARKREDGASFFLGNARKREDSASFFLVTARKREDGASFFLVNARKREDGASFFPVTAGKREDGACSWGDALCRKKGNVNVETLHCNVFSKKRDAFAMKRIIIRKKLLGEMPASGEIPRICHPCRSGLN